MIEHQAVGLSERYTSMLATTSSTSSFDVISVAAGRGVALPWRAPQ